ncbi:MAG: nuclear transport factor 2 family protein [Vicinamibacterales bacterium]
MVEQLIIEVAEEIAQAIGARDVDRLRSLLAPGFTHRTHGGDAAGNERFLEGITAIPGEIVFVRLDDLRVDLTPAGVLVTGFQHAQLKIDGQTIDDRRGFIDWFVEVDGQWKIQAAVDLPGAGA